MPLEPTPAQRGYWLSGDHVGSIRPLCAVRVRKGRFVRGYERWEGRPVNAEIPGSKSKFWQATWQPAEDWRYLPGIFSVEITQGFDANGLMVANIVLENIYYEQITGQTGLIAHVPRPGYFSPLRGFHTSVRPPLFSPGNEWYTMFQRACQVDIQSAYGFGDFFRVFTGLLDESEVTDKPYRINLTCRDFGQALTDQRFFGTVKDPNLRDPIVFAPQTGKGGADVRIKEGSSAASSGNEPGFPPRFVLDKNTSTYWASGPKLSPNNTEWVEVRVPDGRYEAFYLHPAYEDLECWVSFYAKPLKPPVADAKDGDQHLHDDFDPRPLVNGIRQTGLGPSGGWIDLHSGDLVPGSDGGVPYTKHFPSLDEKGGTHRLGAEIRAGDNSIIRVHFRNLHKSRIRFGDYPGQQLYRAGVRSLYGWRLHRKEVAKSQKWILVNDLSDIVKVVLRWAGFKEWEVEDTGINLKGRYVVNRSKFLIDVIKEIADKTGYVFFMSSPSDADGSIGIPVFRRTQSLNVPAQMEELSGDQILTGLRTKWTSQPQASIIHVRGKVHKSKKAGVKDTLGGGTTVASVSDRRIQASYRPPWARWGKDGGIIKHVVQVYPDLDTYNECYMACLLIALAEAVASQQASVEIPVWPGINLDDVVGLRDETGGITSRLWIAQRTLTYQFGQQTSFTETLQGALLDSPEMQQMWGDYVAWMKDAIAKEKGAKDAKGKPPVKRKQPPAPPKTHPPHPVHPTTAHPVHH